MIRCPTASRRVNSRGPHHQMEERDLQPHEAGLVELNAWWNVKITGNWALRVWRSASSPETLCCESN